MLTAAKLKQASINTLPSASVTEGVTTAKTSYLNENTYIVRDLLFQSIELANVSTFNANAIKGEIDNTTGEYETLRTTDSERWDIIKSEVEAAIDQIDGNEYQVVDGQIDLKLETNTYNNLFKGTEAGADAVTPSGKAYNNVVISRELGVDEVARIGRATTLTDIAAYETFITDLAERSSEVRFVQPQIRDTLPDLAGTFTDLKAKLDPKQTLKSKILQNIKVWKNGAYVALEKLKPIMAYPEYDEPVYEALSNISQDYILPNVDKLPANSLTILETNQQVIEALMVGMNHEMARGTAMARVSN